MPAYEQHSDQQLALLLRDDDESAFRVIYDRYWPGMYATASKRLSNSTEAEEVVQDIFLNLWRKRKTFVLRVNFEHYLAVAVKFEVINRRAKRHRKLGLEQHLSAHAVNSTPGSSTWQAFDLKVLQREMEDTISRLPPRNKLVFRMSRQEGYSNKKIAGLLHISEKAVEKHITRALKLLRTQLGHYFFLFFLFSW